MADSPIKPVDREGLKQRAHDGCSPMVMQNVDILSLLSTIEELERERDEARRKSQELWEERSQILRDAGADELALIARAQSAEALLREAVEVVKALKASFGNPLTRRALGGHNRSQQAAMLAAAALLSKLTEGRS